MRANKPSRCFCMARSFHSKTTRTQRRHWMRLDYKWQAAIVTAIGLFMAVLDNTIVNVALPQMRASFHTDQNTIIWVVTAYFLAQAAVIPVTGYVSDLIGT